MNYKIFKKRLAVYGADFARWPEDEAPAARALLAQSSKAQKTHETALRLEAALDGFAVPPAGAALRDRVTDAAFGTAQAPAWPEARRESARPRRALSWQMIPAGAMAMALLALFALQTQPGDQHEAVDSFMQEWQQMITVAEQDLQQADEMLEILIATADTDREAEIERFLQELVAAEEEAWDYL